MNVPSSSASQWSGCESGWTLYLDQSSFPDYNDGSPYQSFPVAGGEGNYAGRSKQQYEDYGYQEEEEGLSMVSDASSGPPTGYNNYYYYEEEEDGDCCNYKSNNSGRSSQAPLKQQQQQQYLDDTASSPALKAKKKSSSKSGASGEALSQGFSATHYKGKSLLKKHLGFFHSSQSVPKEAGDFPGRKWK